MKKWMRWLAAALAVVAVLGAGGCANAPGGADDAPVPYGRSGGGGY